MSWVLFAILFWIAAYGLNIYLSNSPMRDTRAVKLAVPVIFGITVLVVWEGLVRGLAVPGVILPPPSAIAAKFATSGQDCLGANRFLVERPIYAAFCDAFARKSLCVLSCPRPLNGSAHIL